MPQHTPARDGRQILLNRYRVLLTRGRDGVVVVVPKGARVTYEALLEAAMAQLPQGVWGAT